MLFFSAVRGRYPRGWRARRPSLGAGDAGRGSRSHTAEPAPGTPTVQILTWAEFDGL